jgi:hypothetical protein
MWDLKLISTNAKKHAMHYLVVMHSILLKLQVLQEHKIKLFLNVILCKALKSNWQAQVALQYLAMLNMDARLLKALTTKSVKIDRHCYWDQRIYLCMSAICFLRPIKFVIIQVDILHMEFQTQRIQNGNHAIVAQIKPML